jgi:ATP synthase protein I
VLRWQVIVTVALTLVAGLLWGRDGAFSAVLGGAVNIVAGGVYGWRVSRGEARSAGEALGTMLRAEGLKILLIFAGLLLVLTTYKDVVHLAFLTTFMITVGVFAAAIAVRDTEEKN